VNHYTDPSFWEHYNRLPAEVRAVADKNFELLKADLQHPSLTLQAGWAFLVSKGWR
jgi:hypothetical protein